MLFITMLVLLSLHCSLWMTCVYPPASPAKEQKTKEKRLIFQLALENSLPVSQNVSWLINLINSASQNKHSHSFMGAILVYKQCITCLLFPLTHPLRSLTSGVPLTPDSLYGCYHGSLVLAQNQQHMLVGQAPGDCALKWSQVSKTSWGPVKVLVTQSCPDSLRPHGP